MRFFRSLFILLVLMASALPALAQDKNDAAITLPDGTRLTLPAGWAPDDWDGDGLLVASGDSSILILDPAWMASAVRESSLGDVGEVLIDAYDAYYGDVIDESDLEFDNFGSRASAQWYFEDDSGSEGVFITADLDDGTFIAFDIVAPAGERDEAVNVARFMLTSLVPATTTSSGGASGVLTPVTSSTSSTSSGGLTPVTGSGEACFVSVATANSAALRVGPGTNRSSVAFLPPGVDFEVIGVATANDGSEWFKLDKTEAAPRSAANEVWVARDDVDENGDCDSVGEAVAPPVVPIINNPPPTPAPSGDAGTTTTTTTTTTNTGTAPQPGSWTLVFSRQTNGSCQGTGNFVLNTGDVWSNWDEGDYSFSGSLTLSGGNLLFAGDVYRPTGSPGQYVASFDLGSGFNNQVYITLNSPTTFVGQMTGNATFDGVACSISTPLSGRRN